MENLLLAKYLISVTAPLRETKQHYFKNLNLNDITENKTFWRIKKPYFNEKGSTKKSYVETSQF